MIRGDVERCLVVAPGGLVEQWQDELREKFGLRFDILTRDQVEAAHNANPFAERNPSCPKTQTNSRLAGRREVRPQHLPSRADHALQMCSRAVRARTRGAVISRFPHRDWLSS